MARKPIAAFEGVRPVDEARGLAHNQSRDWSGIESLRDSIREGIRVSLGRVVTIIPAAGQGVRMGGKKQFLKLDGIPIFVHTLRKFAACVDVGEIFLAAPQEDISSIEETLWTERLSKQVTVVAGGSRRQDSVENCFRILSHDTELVAVHDAVRPFVSPALISAVIQEAARSGASILGILSVDTVKQVQQTRIIGTIPRERIVLAQTPQVFRYDILKLAFEKAREESFVATDEASLVEHIGHEVTVVPGSERNLKITTPADLELAQYYLDQEHATSSQAAPAAGAGAARTERRR
ncbi:MAG: 2-C-methyl-D-erythritol 4-phosphate cytidylyltransferase [Acidobacteria bacterium]|nr:2-C-methyl-D-erythritol 4-phosphate cytidylyltransferase [Acidobacteriota bacterium]